VNDNAEDSALRISEEFKIFMNEVRRVRIIISKVRNIENKIYFFGQLQEMVKEGRTEFTLDGEIQALNGLEGIIREFENKILGKSNDEDKEQSM